MSHVPAPEPEYNSLTEVTQRMYWFFFGPMFLVLMLLLILSGEKSRLWGCTIAYLVALALLPVVRWFEMRSGRAQTSDGKPMTWDNFRNYSLGTLAVGIVGIVAAHLWVQFAR